MSRAFPIEVRSERRGATTTTLFAVLADAWEDALALASHEPAETTITVIREEWIRHGSKRMWRVADTEIIWQCRITARKEDA